MDRFNGNSDDDAASSTYSSCDGSEFDKYCSANSVMGTASICSSVGFGDWLSDGGVETPRGNGYSLNPVAVDRLSPLGNIRRGPRLTPRSNESKWGSSSKSSALGGGGSNPFSRKDGELLLNESASDYHCQDGMRLKEDGDGSSRCENSEGEDSSLDYGTDEEATARFVERSNLQVVNKIKNENENILIMNSDAAFGLDDWDAFVEETGGDDLASLSLYQESSEIEGDLSMLSMKQEVDARDVTVANYQAEVVDRFVSTGMSLLRDNEAQSAVNDLAEEKPEEGHINYVNIDRGSEMQCASSEGAAVIDATKASEKWVPGESVVSVTPVYNATLPVAPVTRVFEDKEIGVQEAGGKDSLLHVVNGHISNVENIAEGNSISTDVVEEKFLLAEDKMPASFDAYDDMVLDMEEILLDSGKSHGARYSQANRGYMTQQSHHFRDGSSTASTSGTDEVYPLVQCPPKIDKIEIVGAKQKVGDVSFGERLVGVKEYTVYKLRVWSGKDQWEVERRYRDFFALYRQLKTLFMDHGLSLPSPWSSVEQESRKIFGNASPNVISERSTLIQDCLRSVLNSNYPFGTPSSLVCFLSPGQDVHNPGLLKALIPQSLQKLGQDPNSNPSNCGEASQEDISMLGKTISLVVEIKPHKSIRQLLETQQYTCAGCHRYMDAGKTLLRELVQTIGWKKPRFCEYTGQLFCTLCHTNDTSVLPAKVLHHWDFSLYPVSQMAKAYLESIYDQPMLCVSAVNPFLFSKVPALHHVMGIRKKIGAMLPYVRCPFRSSVHRSLGFRKHLLEGNDFFALRDLVDLSKGAFSGLPAMVDTISNKILEHITQQCLVCYDSGTPCAARQACDDPSSLIFPFQEVDAVRCGACGSIFHKPCFGKLMVCCTCGKPTPAGTKKAAADPTMRGDGVSKLSIQIPGSSSSLEFFSGMLSKVRPDKIWRPKNSSPVILMGSLPSTSL